MTNNRDLAKCYIGRCKCGGVVTAVVIDPEEHWNPKLRKEWAKCVADDVAEFIREGLTIETMTVEEVRKQFGNCTCPKPEKATAPQGSLPL